ncbi:hypothetical protein PF005_g13626 [Phytophthora fragariae]|uniref:TLC domain-containing protein n=1 Tax=Phytophthora fragariae TaxID=53985 RepID=A0A6A3ZI90_9STRA|nr:hypothetical protein PF003_g32616 [Phytophthora fragariae]KAE8935120.1 hypothetical protein PF009_g14922 [Phytophthora fragariae]KAE9104698.1 hypothetical protein PF010_g13288 [Phytophthora fragariae]KAE9106671.1 hypothetical protein PF007_g13319 [Phytophthora fragariae]KAE9143061.1 hypothetical protein PF006_g11882 [Phytophthora fragariae]
MLTEALVVTWISICTAMLYSDPRLWVIAASSLAFAVARMEIVPRASAKVKAFPALSPFSQLLFSNTAVSLLHSAVSSLLAISALFTSHSLDGDFVNTVTRGEFLATAVSTGYFAYDLFDYMLNGLYVKSPGIILHHVVVLICYISALVKTVGVPLLSLALQSALLRWVWRTQWGSFVVARFAPHIVVAVLTYQGKNLFAHQLHFLMAFSGIIFINLLNIHLFFDVRKAYRKDCALPKAPPSPAPVTKAS